MGKKSSMKKSNRKVVKKIIEVEEDFDEQDVKMDEMIEFLNEIVKLHKNVYFNVLNDKEGNRKLEIYCRFTNYPPWAIRCSRYRFLARSYDMITKIKQQEYENIYGFGAESRDLGASQSGHMAIWQCIYQNGILDVNRLKSWVNFFINPKESPKPKISVQRNFF